MTEERKKRQKKRKVLLGLSIVFIIGLSSLFFVFWHLGFFNVNTAPKIVSVSPTKNKVELIEGDKLTFQVSANDSDGDFLTYQWMLSGNIIYKDGPKESASQSSWAFQTKNGDRGKYTLKCQVTDGKGGVKEKTWNLIVHFIDLRVIIDDYSGGWIRDSVTDRPSYVIKLKATVFNDGDIYARNITYSVVWNSESNHTSVLNEIEPGGSISWWLLERSSIRYKSTYSFKFAAKCRLAETKYEGTVNVPNFPRSLSMPPNDVKLYITPEDPVIKHKVNEILASKPLLTTDWMAIRDWCGNQIKYEYDDVFYGQPEYWQLPFETIQLGHGDCEDQAILLCSMLRATGYSPTDVYVVLGEINGEGHAWVSFKWLDLLGQQWWIRLEPTAGGGIGIEFFGDIISTFEDRKIWCTFNDVYYNEY